MSKSIRCMLGLHKWLVIKQRDKASIRCQVRDEVRGVRGGMRESMDLVQDRMCQHCGKIDAQIEKFRDAVRLEESVIWYAIKEKIK